jgi:hypothetical protein
MAGCQVIRVKKVLTHRRLAFDPSCWRFEPGKNHGPGSDPQSSDPLPD